MWNQGQGTSQRVARPPPPYPQHPIHRFFVDFYCRAHQLVIEIDGDIREELQEQDEARNRWFTLRGC